MMGGDFVPVNYLGVHDTVVVKLAKRLKKENPGDDIAIDAPRVKRQRRGLQLRDGTTYIPDIANFTQKIAYEVHWRGERKEDLPGKLPEGWRVVNVFIDTAWSPETIVVRYPGLTFKRITPEEFEEL